MNNCMVSVGMITYNHEKYIRVALDSILMQETDFAFEIIIGEDCSTDNTRNICHEYKERYPDKIKLLLPEKNIGMRTNFINTLSAATGKYTAFCEGDDYWIDPYKLQKQVDFLENHKEYNLCSHRFKIYDEENDIWKDDIPHPPMDKVEGVEFNFERMLEVWHAQTMTILFRTHVLKTFNMKQYDKFCDFHLCYHLLKEKNGYCMNLDAAVYRLHHGGVFSKQSLESRTYMGYNTTKDLFKYNQHDVVLKNNFYANKKAYFDNYLRLSIYKKNYSKQLFKDVFYYLKEESCFVGPSGVVFSLKKMLLSFFKSIKVNKINK